MNDSQASISKPEAKSDGDYAVFKIIVRLIVAMIIVSAVSFFLNYELFALKPNDMIIGIYGWDKGGFTSVQSFVLSNGGIVKNVDYAPITGEHPGMPPGYDPGGSMTVRFPGLSDSQVESLQIQICKLPHVHVVRTAKHWIVSCPFIPDPLLGP